MATNIDIQGTPISRLPRESSPVGVDVSGVKSGRTVKVSLDLMATKTELKNIDNNRKGYFSTDTELKTTYPKPKVGWYAYVGSTGTIWKASGNTWGDTGEPIPSDVDLSLYAKKSEVDAEIATVKDKISRSVTLQEYDILQNRSYSHESEYAILNKTAIGIVTAVRFRTQAASVKIKIYNWNRLFGNYCVVSEVEGSELTINNTVTNQVNEYIPTTPIILSEGQYLGIQNCMWVNGGTNVYLSVGHPNYSRTDLAISYDVVDIDIYNIDSEINSINQRLEDSNLEDLSTDVDELKRQVHERDELLHSGITDVSRLGNSNVSLMALVDLRCEMDGVVYNIGVKARTTSIKIGVYNWNGLTGAASVISQVGGLYTIDNLTVGQWKRVDISFLNIQIKKGQYLGVINTSWGAEGSMTRFVFVSNGSKYNYIAFDYTVINEGTLNREVRELNAKMDNIQGSSFIPDDLRNYDVIHILMYGQSLSVGANATPLTPLNGFNNGLMFRHIRTYDFGYEFGISKESYNANPDTYDNQFYVFNKMIESGGYGNNSTKWDNNSSAYFETPCAGFMEGLNEMIKKHNGDYIQNLKLLFSASGSGGQQIKYLMKKGAEGAEGAGEFYARMIKDVHKAKTLCDSKGISYKVGCMAWVQGESDYNTPNYNTLMNQLISDINYDVKEITGQKDDVLIVSYQQTYSVSALNLFSMSIDNVRYFLFKGCIPFYDYPLGGDQLHLTATGSRLLGNRLGIRYFETLVERRIRPVYVESYQVDGNNVTLTFNESIAIDKERMQAQGVNTSSIGSDYGFKSWVGSNNVVTTVEQLNSNQLKVICSSAPTNLTYGVDNAGKPIHPIPGCIRSNRAKYNSYIGEIYIYMPVEVIY